MKYAVLLLPMALLAPSCATTDETMTGVSDLEFQRSTRDVFNAAVAALKEVDLVIQDDDLDEETGRIVARRATSNKTDAQELIVNIWRLRGTTRVDLITRPIDIPLETRIRDIMLDRLYREAPPVRT